VKRALRLTPRRAALIVGGAFFAASLVSAAPASAVDWFPLDNIVRGVVGHAASFASDQVAGAAVASLLGITKFLIGDIGGDFGRHLVNFLLGLPDYTDSRYAALNVYATYVQGIAWGLLALVLLGSALRYWAAGYGGLSAGEAMLAFQRTAAAASGLVAFQPSWHFATLGVNKLTWALASGPGVGGRADRLFIDAFAFSAPSGAMPAFGGVVLFGTLACAVWLLVTKVVLSAALAVLYLGAQLAIALSPLEDLAWLTGIFTRGAIAVLCYPVVWTLCFAAFALLGTGGVAADGLLGQTVARLTGLAALIVAIKLPRMILERGLGWGTPKASKVLVTVRSIPGVSGALGR
jgi:hypothetical protein